MRQACLARPFFHLSLLGSVAAAAAAAAAAPMTALMLPSHA
jgi:hypothetical protein